MRSNAVSANSGLGGKDNDADLLRPKTSFSLKSRTGATPKSSDLITEMILR